MSLDALKQQIRAIGARYNDREQRSRRLFIEEKANSFQENREKEFSIKSEIANYFKIPYTSISFCGSAQLGLSVYQDRLFEPAVSDLDVGIINMASFQAAWIDVITSTSAFNDLSSFGRTDRANIDRFKNQILSRGMIIVDAMPNSPQKLRWTQFQQQISRKHRDLFSKISIAFYMNEYAFCWKQDSALTELIG